MESDALCTLYIGLFSYGNLTEDEAIAAGSNSASCFISSPARLPASLLPCSLVLYGHVYREQNVIVDTLTKQALSLPMGLTTVEQAPSGLRELILEEQMGAKFHRRLSARTHESERS
nr:uncharacterized protein LOC109190924 [Ipomoea trifida]